jgi:hypothetical protein
MSNGVPTGWMPTGFDGTDAILAQWKKRQADYFVIASSGALQPILPPYIEVFDAAQRLFNKGEFEAAVIISQTACEVLGADVLARLARKKAIEYLNPWIRRVLRRSGDFNNNSVRKLYETLSGDSIQSQPFWIGYEHHVRIRHEIVHGGRRLSKQEGQDSLNVVGQFIRHLEQVIAAQHL